VNRRNPNSDKPPRVTEAWYILAQSYELADKPIRRSLFGKPLVMFRISDGKPCVFLDRCPHRGVPLSMGSVRGDRLECVYHGWQFDRVGRCKRVPSLVADPDTAGRCATSYPVIEAQGFIWVYGTPGPMPQSRPFEFRYVDHPDYLCVRYEVRVGASIHQVAENALDVPHTAFLHGGLFRTDSDRNEIKAVVKRWSNRVECEYIGEPRPSGLVGRVLSPSGGVVTHFDRFYLPSVVEVEYRIGDENHFLINGACTPVDDFDTRLYSVTCLRTRLPGFLVRPAVQPIALWIFGQDRSVLEAQTHNMEQFGGMAYASTDVDTLGPHILRLMRRAARGETGDPTAEPWIKELPMMI
jgi:phenylpropionate dioxygenase-like ring-hydroxylating dioxygenase large terminal subunit